MRKYKSQRNGLIGQINTSNYRTFDGYRIPMLSNKFDLSCGILSLGLFAESFFSKRFFNDTEKTFFITSASVLLADAFNKIRGFGNSLKSCKSLNKVSEALRRNGYEVGFSNFNDADFYYEEDLDYQEGIDDSFPYIGVIETDNAVLYQLEKKDRFSYYFIDYDTLSKYDDKDIYIDNIATDVTDIVNNALFKKRTM